MKNKYIIIILALIVVGAGAYYYLVKRQGVVLRTEKSRGDAETAGWKTYRNEEYGFEVKYPENYIASDPNKDLTAENKDRLAENKKSLVVDFTNLSDRERFNFQIRVKRKEYGGLVEYVNEMEKEIGCVRLDCSSPQIFNEQKVVLSGEVDGLRREEFAATKFYTTRFIKSGHAFELSYWGRYSGPDDAGFSEEERKTYDLFERSFRFR